MHSRRGAYVALAVLTLIWGNNWIVMKFALQHAHPVMLNVERTWLATLVLFAVLVAQRRPLIPPSWLAIVVTGFFQTTINFSATSMALAGGGAGRTSVLVFTMPFWTLLIAWPVLHERVKGMQWFAVAFAFAGLALVVEPWNWTGDLGPKLWAVLSGFGWAAGTVATKYFQRGRSFDPLNFIAWQMLVGVLPLTLLPWVFDFPATQWSATYALLIFYVGAVSTALGFPAVDRGPALPAGGHGVAQHVRDSGDRAHELDVRVRRAPDRQRMAGHRVHRRRPGDHLGHRVAREPARRAAAAADAARRRVGARRDALPSPIGDCRQLSRPTLPISASACLLPSNAQWSPSFAAPRIAWTGTGAARRARHAARQRRPVE